MTTTTTYHHHNEAPPTGNKPFEVIRLGNVYASIWRNVNEKGYARYNVSVERSYKDEAGQTQYTRYFNREESLVAAKAFDVANTRLNELIDAEYERLAQLNGVANTRQNGQ